MNFRFLTGAAAVALLAGLALASPARADKSDQTTSGQNQTAQTPAPAAPAPAPAPAAPAHPTWNGIMLSGHIEAGTNINPSSPGNNINFGQLFTDRANSFRMNQATLAAEQDRRYFAITVRPQVFLNLGREPVLPLSRLREMLEQDKKGLKDLLTTLKKEAVSGGGGGDEAEEEGEQEPAGGEADAGEDSAEVET